MALTLAERAHKLRQIKVMARPLVCPLKKDEFLFGPFASQLDIQNTCDDQIAEKEKPKKRSQKNRVRRVKMDSHKENAKKISRQTNGKA